MADTLLARVPQADLTPQQRASREAAIRLAGDATIIEVFANSKAASTLLFEDFYQKVFFGGRLTAGTRNLSGSAFRSSMAASFATGTTKPARAR